LADLFCGNGSYGIGAVDCFAVNSSGSCTSTLSFFYTV
jgi:hypothetical protein